MMAAGKFSYKQFEHRLAACIYPVNHYIAGKSHGHKDQRQGWAQQPAFFVTPLSGGLIAADFGCL
jgi:hypothetical protein